mmetsp:Transcript_4008/g.4098  ORF Transcript_4008/g.4098 Transcript_4008/m.4098 type:complete len:86 (+) Transcript_4008:171-428(+)
MPSSSEVRSLLRSLLRYSRKITDYNFKSYARRRTMQGFRENRKISGGLLEEKYRFGLQQLGVVKRQSVISQLYPEEVSVVVNQGK